MNIQASSWMASKEEGMKSHTKVLENQTKDPKLAVEVLKNIQGLRW